MLNISSHVFFSAFFFCHLAAWALLAVFRDFWFAGLRCNRCCKTLLMHSWWSHPWSLAGHLCGWNPYFAWHETFCLGSLPAPQAPDNVECCIWHSCRLSSAKRPVTRTWEARFVSLAWSSCPLILLCLHSGLGRKMFLIFKDVPMEENSSKLLSQKENQHCFSKLYHSLKKLKCRPNSDWKKWLRIKKGYRWTDKIWELCICRWDGYLYLISSRCSRAVVCQALQTLLENHVKSNIHVTCLSCLSRKQEGMGRGGGSQTMMVIVTHQSCSSLGILFHSVGCDWETPSLKQ